VRLFVYHANPKRFHFASDAVHSFAFVAKQELDGCTFPRLQGGGAHEKTDSTFFSQHFDWRRKPCF
jgi:hypothetical protein